MLSKKYIINNHYLFDPTINTLFNQSDKTKKIILGHNESHILLTLIERKNEVLSKEELNKSVWSDEGVEVNQSSVVQAISTLRKMLNDSTKNPSFILTVSKKGYQFIGSVNDVVDKALIAEARVISDSAEEKVSVNKKTPTLIIPVILGVALLVICLSIVSILLERNNNDLVKVDAINNVPIYSLSNQSRVYTDILLIKQEVKKIINKIKKEDAINKIIVNLNSKHDLIINVISSKSVKNQTYELIGNYGN